MKKFFQILIFILFCGNANAQVQATPEVVASGGGFNTDGNGNSFSYTVGECVVVTASNTNNILTQGFQQPTNDSIILSDSSLISFYTGITPNGDNHNETWIIDGIDSLNNIVSIFNRWGDLVWKGTDYDNVNVVWVGENNKGEKLPPATYFFIINVKNETHKGWVELTR